MKYRKRDANGDFVLGTGADYWIDQPEAVAEAIRTRLGLFTGEWFLDTTEGMPWRSDVLGRGTQNSYDTVIRARILGTTGVTEITGYTSSLDRDTRRLTVSVTVDTDYGTTTVDTTL
jgi:hypothetical protein